MKIQIDKEKRGIAIFLFFACVFWATPVFISAKIAGLLFFALEIIVGYIPFLWVHDILIFKRGNNNKINREK
jgi:hypothetical protein